MGFLRRGDGSRDERMSATTALVIEAPAPPEGGPHLGPGSGLPIKVLADLGSGRAVHERKVRLSDAHWLVPGMDVRVKVDPGKPDAFEIDWESVPSMEARAAANDAALADPIAARRRVAHALGMTQADTGTARTERFERAVEQARATSAPPGRVRAVALIATIRGRRRIVGDADNVATHDTSPMGARARRCSRSPSRDARRTPSMRRPSSARRTCSSRCGCRCRRWCRPRTQPTSRSSGARFPPHEAQLADRIAGSLATQQARSLAISDTAAQIASDPRAMASQMRQLAADNAKRTLLFVKDPAMRKQLIDQYKAAGIDVEQDG